MTNATTTPPYDQEPTLTPSNDAALCVPEKHPQRHEDMDEAQRYVSSAAYDLQGAASHLLEGTACVTCLRGELDNAMALIYLFERLGYHIPSRHDLEKQILIHADYCGT